MNFIKNLFGFHVDVLKKIGLNKLFFLFAAGMYLLSDFIIYLQPLMSAYFSDPTEVSLSSIAIKWGLFLGIWISYFVSASLLSVYFIRKDKTLSKFKYYLKPLINMRVYGAYIFMVFGILFSFFIATKFLPAVTDFLSEGFNIAANKTIEDGQKLSAWLSSPKMKIALEDTAFWQWILALLSFVGVLITVSMSFAFALPLVIKSKSNTLYASIKRSFKGASENFALFFFTLILMLLLKYLVPATLELMLPASFLELLANNNAIYATRPIVALYDALLLFYLIIGLEKFVLTNVKK
jgi:hypothetical protein